MATASTFTFTPALEDLVAELHSAELQTKSLSGDLKQARAKRSTAAVSIIKSLSTDWPVSMGEAEVRSRMIGSGIAKGTVSKILTVVRAVSHGEIMPSEIVSLNGAYNLVKKRAVTMASAATPEPEASSAAAPAPAPAPATTPDQALGIILDSIRKSGSEDSVLKAAGDWIERITTAISDLTREVLEEEEGE